MVREPEERQRFEVLREAVRHELRIVAEVHTMLDRKIERTTQELSKKMDIGFGDVLLAIRTVIRQSQAHEQVHGKIT